MKEEWEAEGRKIAQFWALFSLDRSKLNGAIGEMDRIVEMDPCA